MKLFVAGVTIDKYLHAMKTIGVVKVDEPPAEAARKYCPKSEITMEMIAEWDRTYHSSKWVSPKSIDITLPDRGDHTPSE